jgi:acetylornithine deacetylase/succinyl-diaminopimelate desuccinylase-like protein
MTEELEILQRLVESPSENPPGDEEDVAAFCANLLESLGADVVVHRAAPRRPNVIASFGRNGAGATIVLQAHLDTKPIEHHGGRAAWSTDPYKLTVRDDKAFGVGAADTKGGAAAQLAAVARLVSTVALHGELIWIGAADEENGSLLGTRHLREQGLLRGDFAVVAEPTECRPSLAQLGNVWLRIEASGHGGHAGTPWVARDAVAAIFCCLDGIQELVERRTPDSRFPGHPRVNVGFINGGAHCGTIPDACVAHIDVRLRPGETRERTTAEFVNVACDVATKSGVEISVTPYAQGGCSAHEVNPQNRYVADFVAAASASGGPLPFPGGTDAYLFGESGIAALVYGPGSLAQAHGPNEFVEVAQVRRAAATYERFLTSMLTR